MIDLLYQSPYFYAAIGMIVGVLLLHVRAQGTQAWARNPWMLLAMLATGAGTSYLVSQLEVGYGGKMVFICTAAAWGVTWVMFGLLALWRNNVVIGLILDRRFIQVGIALLVGFGIITFFVNRVDDYAPAVWAYLALPSLSGALYRLLLVLAFLREPLHDREAIGKQIDRALQGKKIKRQPADKSKKEKGKTAEADKKEGQKSSFLFNPLNARGQGTPKS